MACPTHPAHHRGTASNMGMLTMSMLLCQTILQRESSSLCVCLGLDASSCSLLLEKGKQTESSTSYGMDINVDCRSTLYQSWFGILLRSRRGAWDQQVLSQQMAAALATKD